MAANVHTFVIRLFGVLATLLLAGLFVTFRPNPSATEFFERGGLTWPNGLMAIAVYISALAFGVMVIRVWTRVMKDATEIQLTGAALAIVAVLFGAGLLAMWLLFGGLVS
jgi:hypothetical protein